MDVRGGGHFPDARDLAKAVEGKWPRGSSVNAKPFLVCTGGDFLLQLDDGLLEAFHAEGFEVAIETNGTMKSPPAVDWICVSPKAGADLILNQATDFNWFSPSRAQNQRCLTLFRSIIFFSSRWTGPAVLKTPRWFELLFAAPTMENQSANT